MHGFMHVALEWGRPAPVQFRSYFRIWPQCLHHGGRRRAGRDQGDGEAAYGVEVDATVDAYMAAAAGGPGRPTIATETQLRTLDLTMCQDTAIGNHWFRGISGGQRKRVTSGTPHLCWSCYQITSGLPGASPPKWSYVASINMITRHVLAFGTSAFLSIMSITCRGRLRNEL